MVSAPASERLAANKPEPLQMHECRVEDIWRDPSSGSEGLTVSDAAR
ncbi:MAG: hypothetical protein V9G15_15160 [Dermatophilaceae bacterium]